MCIYALISPASKVTLKILQARLQQYVNRELPDVQAGFRKGIGPRDQIATSVGSQNQHENSRKHLLLLRRLHWSLLLCGSQQTWKILKEMGIPDHLTCLLRYLYVGQEATVRTVHGTTHCFKIGERVCQGCILPPCLFNKMQSTSCEMPGWISHKLLSRLSHYMHSSSL